MRRDRSPVGWSGLVATIVALAVGGGFAFAMIGVTVQHDPVSTQGAALLNTLGGGLIAVLSLWVGGQVESTRTIRDRENTVSTTTPDEPRDPVTNPDHDIEAQPQDPEAVPQPAPTTEPGR